MAISFKPYYKSDNLIGEGTVKFRPYTVTKPVTTKTLAAGTYKWKDIPTLPSNTIETVFDFTYNDGEAIPQYGVVVDNVSIAYFSVAGGVSPAVAYDSYGWDDNRQTITLATDQQVSAEFYTWAITGGNLVKESAIGTWLLNTTLIKPTATQRYNVNFKYPGGSISTAQGEISIQNATDYPVFRISEYDSEAGEDLAYSYYWVKSGNNYKGSTSGNYCLKTYTYNDYLPITTQLRTIQITDGADIYNGNLIAWLKANAVKQS